MRSITIVIAVIVLLSLCMYSTVSAPSPLASTVLRLDPATVELGPAYCVNETFTIKARIDNVEDLSGFELYIGWNTTYIDYIEHIVKVPVETFPDGLLHGYIWSAQDEVNASEGWYRLAIRTLTGPSFYGSGIAFEITYNVTSQPASPEAEVIFSVEFTQHTIASSNVPIPHYTENCSVIIHSYWNPADVNDDLKVDIFDVLICANAYQATPSDPHWNPRCDIADPYEVINIFDIVKIVASYGEECLS